MAKKIYVAEPKIVINTTDFSLMTLCYAIYEWEQGELAIAHVPCSDEARIEFEWGEGIVEIRQRVADDLLASFPDISSNDIIFLGGWN